MSAPIVDATGGLGFRTHNPDVLTCIANLSNDEVFTPPEFANQMLDTLEQGWAQSNGGASIWADSTVTFLDPFTKSGVFLREITRRLTDGLADEIPDLEERVDHILTKQVFGIGITQLTALLARRSLYCSKDATGKHSIAKSFDRDWGNVWFERTEHTWVGDRCGCCGAKRVAYERDGDLETHAYAFIHATNIKRHLAKMFGADVQFDVIIGNPPYQIGSDGGTRDIPIYHRFVEAAKRLDPQYLTMVIPSRWMAGGLGLKDFREEMLSDQKISDLVDYPVARDVFPGVEIKGGVCYFLRGRSGNGITEVTTIREGQHYGPVKRALDQHDVFVRDVRSLKILDRVLAFAEPMLSEVMSARTAFGLASNFKEYHVEYEPGDVKFYATGPKGRFTAWIRGEQALVNADKIDSWKAMVPKAGSDGGQKLPDVVLGKPWIAERPSVCTQSFLFVETESEEEAKSVVSYYATRFVRFLVSLRKITQDTTASSYKWVPQQAWDREWTDADLYVKYGITADEQSFIEAHVKAMDMSDA